MTPDELRWVESRLALDVPSSYRALVTAYPERLLAYAGDYDLLEDPREVVVENILARHTPGMSWPRTMLVVGVDDHGRRFCLDLTRTPSPVLAFDPASRLFVEISPSFELWWPRLLREYEDAG